MDRALAAFAVAIRIMLRQADQRRISENEARMSAGERASEGFICGAGDSEARGEIGKQINAGTIADQRVHLIECEGRLIFLADTWCGL